MNPRNIDFARLGIDPEMRLSPHVVARETICRCGQCGLYLVSEETLGLFEAIRAELNRRRAAAGLPEKGIEISSGVRCLAYQHRLKKLGLSNSVYSLHVPKLGTHVGHALDLLIPWAVEFTDFFPLCREVVDAHPTAGLGLYPKRRFVHIDDGWGVAPRRRW